MNKLVKMMFCFVLLFLCEVALAEDNATVTGSGSDKAVSDVKSDGQTTFGGMTFGTGLSVAFNRGSSISNAEVINGLVRVTEETPAVARIVLETHYLFTCANGEKGNWCGKGSHLESSGHGPFLAIQPGQADLIQAIGMGWMLAFRHKEGDTKSWNIGLGYMVDPKVKVLGDGIVANQPLPAGETQVRFKITARYSWFLVSSYTF